MREPNVLFFAGVGRRSVAQIPVLPMYVQFRELLRLQDGVRERPGSAPELPHSRRGRRKYPTGRSQPSPG